MRSALIGKPTSDNFNPWVYWPIGGSVTTTNDEGHCMTHFHQPDPEYDDTRNELLQERNRERRYRRELAAHPDPRDPDYPGDESDGE